MTMNIQIKIYEADPEMLFRDTLHSAPVHIRPQPHLLAEETLNNTAGKQLLLQTVRELIN